MNNKEYRENGRAHRVYDAMSNVDWTEWYKQIKWLADQNSVLEPTGEEATEAPEGILNFMEMVQDAWEGGGMDAAIPIWEEFGDVPMNPETECIEEDWRCFPAGTHRETIWHWFEDSFDVQVYDLMYHQYPGDNEEV